MSVDKEAACALGDAVAICINDWVQENLGGQVAGSEILSMLITHAAKVIATSPNPEHRVSLFVQATMALLSGCEAEVAVSFFSKEEVQGKLDRALAAAEPQGRA